MSKKSFYVFLLGTLVMAGCSSSGTKPSESTEPKVEANTEETEVQNDSADVAEKKAFLENFYKKNIAEEGGDIMMIDPEAISEHMTEQAKKTLLEAYDMECPTNDCMAVWLFYGEGIDDIVKSINIVPADEKDHFNVELSYNGSNSYKVSIEVVRQDDKLMINNIAAI